MDGGELHFFCVVSRILLGLDVGEQGQLREELLHGAELKRELRELPDFVEPPLVVVVGLLQIIVIARVQDEPEHFRGAPASGVVLQLDDRGDKLGPSGRRLFGDRPRASLKGRGDFGGDGGRRLGHHFAPGRQDRRGRIPALKFLEQLFRPLGADARQEQRQALERDLIARIGHQLQIRRHVLDVGLLKEPDAAGDGEGDLAPRQLQLQFEHVEMGAVQHRHVVQAGALLAQFQDALGYKGGLLPGVLALDQRGFHARFPGGRELLGKLVHVRGDGGVGHRQNFRRAPVIGLDLVHIRSGIALRKIQDVRKIRAPPSVDALRVVAHHRQVVMPARQQIDEIALEPVRVLVLVHEDELEPALIMLANLRMLLHQLEPEREQVVEVHAVRRPLAGNVTPLQIGDLRPELREMAELALQQRGGGAMGVGRQRKNFVQDIQLGKMLVHFVQLRLHQAGLDEILRVLAVEDGEVLLVAEHLRVAP